MENTNSPSLNSYQLSVVLHLEIESCEISPIYFGMSTSIAMFRSYLDSHIVEISRVHCLLYYFKSLFLASCEEPAKALQFKECALDPRRLPPQP